MKTYETNNVWDEQKVKSYLMKEPWVIEIAIRHTTYKDLELVIKNFICKYWPIKPEEVSTRDVGDILWIAKNYNEVEKELPF